MNSFRLSGKGLWARYEHALHKRPVLTQMTTSALLWGLGDVLAQRVAERVQTVDKRRIGLTAGFGAGFMGPVGHFWYQGLDIMASKLLKPGTGPFLIGKVVADTFILGPLYVIAFYAYGSYFIDQTGWQGFHSKITKDFFPTFLAELAIWPAFQTFNFTKIPVNHQLLAVNCMTLVDASFLSWARSQENWVDTMMASLPGADKKQEPVAASAAEAKTSSSSKDKKAAAKHA
uniref:Peroxisomal membrane protein MPV17 n=1 Tax=Chlamydomonas leiostraca TaxID=1034604 RepID=A0A7S0RWM4_9CHLO|mmetsp:Transcript_32828/g.83317  ORF Transcript_32828/g.83317 Transcript_32828/m.83317 type:complete len:231 (+) Transcript_32828:175-867(+)